MLFPSLQFAAFMLVLLGVLFIFRRSTPRKLILLAASWLFYMAWNPVFLVLLLATSMVDYWAARQIYRLLDARRRKLYLVLALSFNLGLLAYFKYAGFLAGSLLYFLRTAGFPVDWHLWAITLPIGISFYTFQSMSYTIDVYRGELAPTESPLDYMLFVAFFPHLVAGPILRAIDFLPQLRRPVQLRWDAECMLLIGSGLVKKVLVADNLAPYVNAVLAAPEQQGSLALMLAALCFSVQIYCDFSGYSGIAIGLGRLLGYYIPENFHLPLLAQNPTDFWHRWHISLSTWLRDYVYIPLGGNRGGAWLTYRNILLTMLLGGLWHGAHWNFVLWGAVHGLLLIGHRLWSRSLKRLPLVLAMGKSAAGRLLSWGLFTYVLLLTWLIFRLTDTAQMLAAARTYLVFDGHLQPDFPPHVDRLLTLAVLAGFWLLHVLEGACGLRARLLALPRVWAWVYLAVCAGLLAVFWPSKSAPFIYFQF